MLQQDDLFEAGRQVILLGVDAGTEFHTEIEVFRRQHGRCVVKFRGIDSISEAEKFVGNEIRILANTLPVLEEGWFYTFQLKGCRVFGTNGEFFGIVTEILDSGGTELLKVDQADRETLIPFAHEYLKKIDPDRRMIEVDLPQSLRDLNK